MRRSATRGACFGVALALGFLCPTTALGQAFRDSVPLAVPPLDRLVCSDESSALPPGLGRGVRAFSFEVSSTSPPTRRTDLQLLAEGPPREIGAVFDSLGQAILLTDELTPGPWLTVMIVVRFSGNGSGGGLRTDTRVDSAAVTSRLTAEGLRAGLGAIPEASRRTSTPLDTSEVRRAWVLARALWDRRCP